MAGFFAAGETTGGVMGGRYIGGGASIANAIVFGKIAGSNAAAHAAAHEAGSA
jgi:fumarate reductase flavoprotein subunit